MKNCRVTALAIVFAMSIFSVSAEEVFVKSGFYQSNTRQTLNEQLHIPVSPASVPTDAPARALANKNYPVTPGDVYVFTYYDQNTATTTQRLTNQSLQVDAAYNIRVPYVGVINAKGMTYLEFKQKAEEELYSFYAYMRPQFSLSGCGTFDVFVCGEVEYAAFIKTWSLARLSDFCQYATKYASTRTVYLKHADGSVQICDLYKAFAQDSAADNPYVKPGDEIRFVKCDRAVYISGAVKKPGQFQLLPSETLEDVINLYAKSYEFNADKEVVTVGNYVDGAFQTKTIDYATNKKYMPKDMDSIYIKNLNEAKPFVIVQGAVMVLDGNTSQSGKFNYEFFPGETAEEAIRTLRDKMLTNSETSAIYILRGTEEIPVDTVLAFTTSERGKTVLEQGDVIVVPYMQQYVVVSGGFNTTGRIPYEPNKSADYYIRLAGGYSADARTSSLRILDSVGKPVKDKSNIQPNTLITVNRRKTNAAADIALVAAAIALGSTIVGLIQNATK